ncbi:Protein HOS4 [Hanseniaspora osmophila]|uniref:Protein HOS4 n=1 Tax=Hanseniaspora osmophila TaxID=56408 RepID=A0A1E5RNM5_9ASCO|nr:Protein HOS4 [Hanseniaspora osmophila]
MNTERPSNAAGAENANSSDDKANFSKETIKSQEPKRRSLSSYLTNRTKQRSSTPVPSGTPEDQKSSPKTSSNVEKTRSSYDLNSNQDVEGPAIEAFRQPTASEPFDLSTAILMSIQNKQQSEQQEKQREREQQLKKQNEALLRKQEQQRQQGAKFNQQQLTNTHKVATHDVYVQNKQQRNFQPPLFKSRFQPHQERSASQSGFIKSVSPSTEQGKSLSPKKVLKNADQENSDLRNDHKFQKPPMLQISNLSTISNSESQKKALSLAPCGNEKVPVEDKTLHVSFKPASVDVKSSQGTETLIRKENIQKDKAYVEPIIVSKSQAAISSTENGRLQGDSFKDSYSTATATFENNEISSDAETEPSHSPLKPRKGRLIRGDQISAEAHPRKPCDSPLKVSINESYFIGDSSESELSDINDLEEEVTGLNVGSSILASSPVKPNFLRPPTSAPSNVSGSDYAPVSIKKEKESSPDVTKWEKRLMGNYAKKKSTDDCFTEPKSLHVGKAVTKHTKHISRDPYGRSKLHQACIKGKREIVRQLVLEDGYSVNDQDHSGQSALHLAAANGHLDIVKFLVEQGCNINIKTRVEDYDTPLMDACLELEYEIVKYLLENGADAFYVNSIGDTALKYMENRIAEDDYEKEDEEDIFKVIKLLKQHMKIADEEDSVNLKLNSGAHSPALGEDEDEEIVLTPSGRRRNRSITPFNAAGNGDGVMNFDDITSAESYEKPKTMHGKMQDKFSLARTTKRFQNSDSSSDSDSSNEDLTFEVTDLGTKSGKNKLLKASQVGDYNYVGQYLQNGGRVDNRVFVAACENGHIDLINLYLGIGGADSNLKLSKRPGKPSILMVSCGKGHFETVRLLVESGADVNYKDEMGHTCAYYSQKGDNIDQQEYQYLEEFLLKEETKLKKESLGHVNGKPTEEESAAKLENTTTKSAGEEARLSESLSQVRKPATNPVLLKNEENESLADSKHYLEPAIKNPDPISSPSLQKFDDFKSTQDFAKKSSPSVVIKKVKLNDHSSAPTKISSVADEDLTKTTVFSKAEAHQATNNIAKKKDHKPEIADEEVLQDKEIVQNKNDAFERPVSPAAQAAIGISTTAQELGHLLKDDEKIEKLAKQELSDHADQCSEKDGHLNHAKQKTDAQLEEDEEYQQKIQEIKNKKKLEMLQQIKQYELQKQAEQEEKMKMEKLKLAEKEERKKKFELDQQLAKHRMIRSYYPLGLKNIFCPQNVASKSSDSLAVHATKMLDLLPIYYRKFDCDQNRYVLDLQIMSIHRGTLPEDLAKKNVEWKEIDFIWNFFKPLFLYVDEFGGKQDVSFGNIEAKPDNERAGLKCIDDNLRSPYTRSKVFQSLSEQIQFENAEKKLLYSLEMHWVKLDDVLNSLDAMFSGVDESAEIRSLIERKVASSLVEITTSVPPLLNQTAQPSLSSTTTDSTPSSAHLLSDRNSCSNNNIKHPNDNENDLRTNSLKVDKNDSTSQNEFPLRFRGRSSLLINNIIDPRPLW